MGRAVRVPDPVWRGSWNSLPWGFLGRSSPSSMQAPGSQTLLPGWLCLVRPPGAPASPSALLAGGRLLGLGLGGRCLFAGFAVTWQTSCSQRSQPQRGTPTPVPRGARPAAWALQPRHPHLRAFPRLRLADSRPHRAQGSVSGPPDGRCSSSESWAIFRVPRVGLSRVCLLYRGPRLGRFSVPTFGCHTGPP